MIDVKDKYATGHNEIGHFIWILWNYLHCICILRGSKWMEYSFDANKIWEENANTEEPINKMKSVGWAQIWLIGYWERNVEASILSQKSLKICYWYEIRNVYCEPKKRWNFWPVRRLFVQTEIWITHTYTYTDEVSVLSWTSRSWLLWLMAAAHGHGLFHGYGNHPKDSS